MKTLFTIIIITFFSASVFGQAGALDSSFGTNGIVITDFNALGAEAYAIQIQSDGKIVVAGSAEGTNYNPDFAVARYNSDGSLDFTFGTEGKVLTPIDIEADYARSLAILADGKLIAAGSSTIAGIDKFALVKYNFDGTIDSTFGTNGKTTTFVGLGDGYPTSMQIQIDGKIIVAGSLFNGADNDFVLVRYDQDGIVDSSFGVNGFATTNISSGYDQVNSIALQSDGKIVAGGYSGVSPNFNFTLVRYNTTGYVDSSFAENGIAITSIDISSIIKSIIIQPDQKIVAAGSAYSDYYDSQLFALARYNFDGNLDSSFNLNGKLTTLISWNYDQANAVLIMPDEKILAAGTMDDNWDMSYGLVRYNSNGSVDSSFGNNAIVKTIIYGRDVGYSAALQSNGNIVVAGIAKDTYGLSNFGVVRYLSGLNVGIITFTSQNFSPLIYPNPIQQNEVLEYTLTKDESLTLSLYDVNGRLIKNFFIQEKRNAGEHKEELNIGDIAAGNYLLTLSNGEFKVSVKIVKQ